MAREVCCLCPAGRRLQEGPVASWWPSLSTGVGNGGSCWPVSCGTVTSELPRAACWQGLGVWGGPSPSPGPRTGCGAVMSVTVELCDGESGSRPLAPQCECAKPSPSGWSPHPPETLGKVRVAPPPPPAPCNALNRPGRLLHAPATRTHSYTRTLAHTRPAGPPFPLGLGTPPGRCLGPLAS